MRTPILETDRLILRPFCMEDAQEVLHCWESDPDVAKYMFWASHNDINKTIDWIKEELGVKEIIGRHAKENATSGKVLEKLGFAYIKDIAYECNMGENQYESKEYILKL